MKKYNLFKILFIILAVLVVFTWLIPASQMGQGGFEKAGYVRTGLFDILNFPATALQYFGSLIVFILVVGAFYAVLSKTGKYKELLQSIANKLKGKETIFLIVIAFLFAALNSVLGFGIIMFLFIPAIISLILLLGYDKITAFLISIGSIFIGMIGSTFNLSTVGYINQTLSTSYETEIIAKIAIFVISFVIYILFTLKYANKVKANPKKSIIGDKNEDMFLGEIEEPKAKKGAKTKKVAKTAKVWPIIAVFSLLLVLIVLGCTPWADVFKISVFENLHKAITEFKIGDYTVFGFILGEVSELGKWLNYAEISGIVFLSTIVIGAIYKLGLNGIIEGMIEGFKKVAGIAFLVAMVTVIIIIATYPPAILTISNWLIGWVDDFGGAFVILKVIAILITSFLAILGSIMTGDMVYLSQLVLPYFGTLFSGSTSLIAIIFQTMYGLTMFIAPTSLLLIIGLEYLKIPYKTWFKFSWKLLLQLFIILFAIFIILAVI